MEKDGRKDVLLRYYTWNEHSTALVEYLLFETFSTWQKNMQVTFVYIFITFTQSSHVVARKYRS